MKAPRDVTFWYHADAHGLPAGKWTYGGKLKHTFHAGAEASQDRYGTIDLPHWISDTARIVEVGLDAELRWVHALYRQSLDAQRDVVLAIDPRTGVVKNVWVNLRSDLHRTLDKTPYDRPTGKTIHLL